MVTSTGSSRAHPSVYSKYTIETIQKGFQSRPDFTVPGLQSSKEAIYDGTGVTGGIQQVSNPQEAADVVIRVVSGFLNLLGLLAVGAIIFAGVLLVVGGQTEEIRQRSRRIIFYAIVGLLVVMGASAVVRFVVSAP